MSAIQELLHKLELGGGQRYVRTLLFLLLLLLVFFGYNIRSFRNMDSREAMDAAQLARNIASGEGYTTKFIRPLGIHLLRTKSFEQGANSSDNAGGDPGYLKRPHPDISNPPVYPVVLAGLMKILPFKFDNLTPSPFWYRDGSFWRSQPDFLIGIFNQVLMIGVLIMTWLLTRRLFDEEVAWIATICLLGTELLWRFSVSGLSTMLLLLITVGLLWLLNLLEAEGREPKRSLGQVLLIAAATGLLVGIGGLTRYSYLWMILPVVAFLLLFMGGRRIAVTGTTLAVFAIVVTPWVVRNIHHSGLPFGIATYAPIEESGAYRGDKLQRSLDLELTTSDVLQVRYKAVANLRTMAQKEIFQFSGSWIVWFFGVGLLMMFRNPATQRIRYFILMAFVTLFVVQAVGRTQISSESPEINSENLLVLLLPGIVIYGVAFFLMLLDNIKWSLPVFRKVAIIGFVIVSSLSLILTLAPPRPIAVAYPPYYPPHIQQVSEWMKPDELMMTDVPWAVAWYGNRQALWLTLDVSKDFYTINDYQKPIQGLFLTAVTMDAKFVSTFLRSGDFSWGEFILQSMYKSQLPRDFPLRSSTQHSLFWPEEFFLTDWPRWRATTDSD